jgi:hypothetical protein
MKSKYIHTSEIEKWKRLETIGYLFPVVIFILLYICSLLTNQQAKTDISNPIIHILLLLFVTAMISIPVLLLWRALFRQFKSNAIKRATFQAELGIDYYRDKLEGISPVEISMLTDFKIEPEKDVSALLLKYQLKGILKIDDKNVVLRPDDESLLPSDKLLLQAIVQHGGVSHTLLNYLSEWKNAAFQEVLQSKYFQNKDQKRLIKTQNRSCLLGCLTAILVPIIIGVGGSLLLNSAPVKHTMALIENMSSETTNSDIFYMISTDSNLAMGILFMLLFILLLIFGVFWPIATMIRSTTKISGMARIRRTEEGEQMAEYIYAMKNFLHDFSNLSEANKEQLVLWDDFLIYAVLLEENVQILQNIFTRKSLKLNDIILNT